MAYVYYDYASQATAALRLTRLRLHIGEVTLQMGPEISADGKSRSSNAIQQYLKDLRAEEKTLVIDSDIEASRNGGMSLVRFRNAR